MRHIGTKHGYGSNGLNLHRFESRLMLRLTLKLAIATVLICSTTGCSILIAEPPMSHVQIEGLNQNLGRFSIDIDPMSDQQLDIHLSDHYALRLDFKWLWERSSNTYFNPNQNIENDGGTPLAPWITCRYQF